MHWNIFVVAICVIECHSIAFFPPVGAQWGSWSPCSTTCGKGVRERVNSQTKREREECFLQFCPSYLSWPRMHFSGSLLADTSTVNNIRCAFENDEFAASQLAMPYIGVKKKKITHTYYDNVTSNWNPDGGNQIYFMNTHATSFCHGPGDCRTNDSVVGLEFTEAARGVVAELDTDWQFATEFWAWRIRIPGVLEASYESCSHHVVTVRVKESNQKLKDVGYSHGIMARFKSKLRNITWYDDYYKHKYNDADVLSIQITMDLYNQYSLQGRITGTIGLTSPDDSLGAIATRVLRPILPGLGNAPFFIHEQKWMTLDLGSSIYGREDGRILASDYGKLDLALMLPKTKYCKYYPNEANSICDNDAEQTGTVSKFITTGGEVSKRIGDDTVWYLTYGGIIDFDLSNLDTVTWNLIQKSRLAIMEQDTNGSIVYMSEFAKGMTIGIMNDPTVRLNPGDNKTWQTFVSSYGKPVPNVEFDIFTIPGILADADCMRPSCNRSNGIPSDALKIVSTNPSAKSNKFGLVTFVMTAAKDPGNVRGCGLDGQIYPLRMLAKYNVGNTTISYSDGGIPGGDAQYQGTTLSICARIYNEIPVKTCPSWEDVRNDFVRFYNLYPVMWKTGVIDLHSYMDIRKKAKMLEVAMFQIGVDDPRHMPISRDLSAGRTKMIENWIKCGMKRFDEPDRQNDGGEQKSTNCTKEYYDKELKEIHILLNKALMFELSTISPYVTAWLSLKTKYGRNKEVADILKSVFVEEMLHMSLDANILNSIRGKVIMTDESKLPTFPTILASGDDYQLFPNVQVSIQPFSIGLVQDIFSGVEKPADKATRDVFYTLAKIWRFADLLQGNNKSTSLKMKMLVQEAMYSGGSVPRAFTSNATRTPAQLIIYWEHIKHLAETELNIVERKLGRTIADLYARIALRMTILESCLKIADLESRSNNVENIFNSSTIFNGDPSYQLNDSNWYEENANVVPIIAEILNMDDNVETSSSSKSNVTFTPLFEVVDLRTALEAIVQIVYQGEGGSECSPFVPEPNIYADYEGRENGRERSHYYRFQEIVQGRELIRIKQPPNWANIMCLNATNCPSLIESGETYCYAGKQILFHEDGVWPIMPNPAEKSYETGSKASLLSHQFNLLYTRMLFCLEDTFGGDPDHIKICMTIMYDLTIAGKRLVQTPLQIKGDTTAVDIGTTGINGAPTWKFVREKPFRAGFPEKA